MCCSSGAVTLPIANDTPEPIRILLTDTYVNAIGKVLWTDGTAHFQQNIRLYNNAISFTSLGAELDRAITNTMNAARVYIFRIHGALSFYGKSCSSSRHPCSIGTHLRRWIVYSGIFVIILDHLEGLCFVSAETFAKYS